MARCSCSGQCSCLIRAGAGVDVDGSGQVLDPYIISAHASIGFYVQDSPTVNLSLVGVGSDDDPFVLSAQSLMALTALTDRTGAAPAVGDVPVWLGNNQWQFGPPPVAPAGATNTAHGITGQGSVANPVSASTSGTWGVGPLSTLGSDTTIGQVIYVDAAGQLRAAPQGTLQVSWANILGTPSTFNTTWAQVAGRPSSFNTTWAQVTYRPKIVLGSFTQASLAPGAAAYHDVTFPSGVFATLPILFGSTSNSSMQPSFSTRSVVSARVGVANVGAATQSSCSIHWMAMTAPGQY